MRTTTKNLAAGAGALLTAAALALGGSAAAFAAPPLPAPESSDVIITKLKQQTPLGAPGDGTEWDSYDPASRIDGVTFEAYLVPGTGKDGANDIGTNAGQQAAAQLTPSAAQSSIDAASPAVVPTTGVTGAAGTAGQIRWDDLPRGLYLVKENLSSMPAGVTASAPFLLAVPMTDPVNRDAWMDTIYIYPKNAAVTAVKTVDNASVLTVGETVDWTIATDIPLLQNPSFDGSEPVSATNPQFVAPDAYRIDDTLVDEQLTLAPAFVEGANGGIVVTVAGAALTEGTDYAVVRDLSVTGQTTYRIVFEAAGLTKLAEAVNADATAQVEVTLTTTVQSADEITNNANFFPNQNAITNNRPFPATPSQVKYGSTQLNKVSTDAAASLAGAQFRVFASEADALAQTNPLMPAVDTDNYDAATGTWTTPASGELVLEGLRFSNFADGEAQLPFLDASGNQTDVEADKATDNPKYQTYWLVEVEALAGHQLLAEPIAFTITSTDASATAFEVTNQHNTGAFVLPLTGGTGTAFLTIAGIALLAVVLLVARRRRAQAVTAE
ncbi:SpaH/EbpB family LPXTG-anchored major pilin [Salinibacterium sp. ZJ70]|uniref:SpaH/EbpB family LPXTG-anchored major pilin n=1 Tax=Salinibacterium sp. ZJ70 TaxID=2708084 RepID=UPI001422B9D8|nr:SpaH/EbpB family LPXTG-anchored major pilin [Salinibacterium sp. ZJ70]